MKLGNLRLINFQIKGKTKKRAHKIQNIDNLYEEITSLHQHLFGQLVVGL
jgi:hypothetical protein